MNTFRYFLSSLAALAIAGFSSSAVQAGSITHVGLQNEVPFGSALVANSRVIASNHQCVDGFDSSVDPVPPWAVGQDFANHSMSSAAANRISARPTHFDSFSASVFSQLDRDGRNRPGPSPSSPHGGNGVGTTASVPYGGLKEQVSALSAWWAFAIAEPNESAAFCSVLFMPSPCSSGVFRPPRG